MPENDFFTLPECVFYNRDIARAIKTGRLLVSPEHWFKVEGEETYALRSSLTGKLLFVADSAGALYVPNTRDNTLINFAFADALEEPRFFEAYRAYLKEGEPEGTLYIATQDGLKERFVGEPWVVLRLPEDMAQERANHEEAAPLVYSELALERHFHLEDLRLWQQLRNQGVAPALNAAAKALAPISPVVATLTQVAAQVITFVFPHAFPLRQGVVSDKTSEGFDHAIGFGLTYRQSAVARALLELYELNGFEYHNLNLRGGMNTARLITNVFKTAGIDLSQELGFNGNIFELTAISLSGDVNLAVKEMLSAKKQATAKPGRLAPAGLVAEAYVAGLEDKPFTVYQAATLSGEPLVVIEGAVSDSIQVHMRGNGLQFAEKYTDIPLAPGELQQVLRQLPVSPTGATLNLGLLLHAVEESPLGVALDLGLTLYKLEGQGLEIRGAVPHYKGEVLAANGQPPYLSLEATAEDLLLQLLLDKRQTLVTHHR